MDELVEVGLLFTPAFKDWCALCPHKNPKPVTSSFSFLFQLGSKRVCRARSTLGNPCLCHGTFEEVDGKTCKEKTLRGARDKKAGVGNQ